MSREVVELTDENGKLRMQNEEFAAEIIELAQEVDLWQNRWARRQKDTPLNLDACVGRLQGAGVGSLEKKLLHEIAILTENLQSTEIAKDKATRQLASMQQFRAQDADQSAKKIASLEKILDQGAKEFDVLLSRFQQKVRHAPGRPTNVSQSGSSGWYEYTEQRSKTMAGTSQTAGDTWASSYDPDDIESGESEGSQLSGSQSTGSAGWHVWTAGLSSMMRR